MSEEIKWTWIPRVSIGPLGIKQVMPENLPPMKLRKRPVSDPNVYESFEVNDGEAYILLEDDAVEVVNVTKGFIFESVEVIGKDIDEIMDMIGGEWEPRDEDDIDFEVFGSDAVRAFQNDDLGIILYELHGAIIQATVYSSLLS